MGYVESQNDIKWTVELKFNSSRRLVLTDID